MTLPSTLSLGIAKQAVLCSHLIGLFDNSGNNHLHGASSRRVAGRDACVPSYAWKYALACQFAIVGGAAFLPHNRFEIESLIMLFVKKDL